MVSFEVYTTEVPKQDRYQDGQCNEDERDSSYGGTGIIQEDLARRVEMSSALSGPPFKVDRQIIICQLVVVNPVAELVGARMGVHANAVGGTRNDKGVRAVYHR